MNFLLTFTASKPINDSIFACYVDLPFEIRQSGTTIPINQKNSARLREIIGAKVRISL